MLPTALPGNVGGYISIAGSRVCTLTRWSVCTLVVLSIDVILTHIQSELISEHLVIFVVSTTGSGTEPRSMTPLWQQLLRSDLPPDLFEDLEYASFGLGDTSYEKFCWPSKLLARRMESLGGSEICKRGRGMNRIGSGGSS
jgi:sulfite reductase alpha subunit-like flavoprotein